MIVAMPRVKPSITGHGMNVTALPRPVTPAVSDDESGQHGHHCDAAEPVVRHDGRQHHRHGPGRTRHLDVRSAEHRGHQTGDHRGDQAGRAPTPELMPNA